MEMLKKPDTPNPSVSTQKVSGERKRIPMTAPARKLEVPPIAGYHLHWFNSNPTRLAQAQRGGYEFVSPEEVELNSVGLGSNTAATANTDLGSRVSIVSGQDERGGVEELILMKIKEEWYNEDQKILEQRNDAVAEALAGGTMGAGQAGDTGEQNMRYVGSRTKMPDMFTKGAFARRQRVQSSR